MVCELRLASQCRTNNCQIDNLKTEALAALESAFVTLGGVCKPCLACMNVKIGKILVRENVRSRSDLMTYIIMCKSICGITM